MRKEEGAWVEEHEWTEEPNIENDFDVAATVGTVTADGFSVAGGLREDATQKMAGESDGKERKILLSTVTEPASHGLEPAATGVAQSRLLVELVAHDWWKHEVGRLW
ncbi:hypothetical protein PIB30_002056 [Stylosanthes scabra]|uniref:Uncharacterized protein n=1 Tax=Stylosanthes scabra TaxID=79078 RepID=A0ABU6Q2R9_9FABA|nr:hypothetical protein [Stylosanthes scabra]